MFGITDRNSLIRNLVTSPIGTNPERDKLLKAIWTEKMNKAEQPSSKDLEEVGMEILLKNILKKFCK